MKINNYIYWKDKKYINNEKDNQLFQYFELIKDYNKVMNLTGIDDKDGVYLKHFYDSLSVDKYLKDKENLKVADIGSGAGFPGIVLAICFPQNIYYLIEPLKKRCKFLEVVVNKLNLTNVVIIPKRAEDITIKFDMILSRAVSELRILSELSIPLLNVGGLFIPLKGSKGREELEDAKNALISLNSKVLTIDEFKLPIEDSMRINIVIEKLKETNKKYPRNYGMIKKKPL